MLHISVQNTTESDVQIKLIFKNDSRSQRSCHFDDTSDNSKTNLLLGLRTVASSLPLTIWMWPSRRLTSFSLRVTVYRVLRNDSTIF